MKPTVGREPKQTRRVTPRKTKLRFGFDAAGGFIALNDIDRRAAYAYPNSFYAESAAKSPDLAARAANELLATLSEDEGGYIRLSAALVDALRVQPDDTK